MTMMRMARTPQVRTFFGANFTATAQRYLGWQKGIQVSCVCWQWRQLMAVWGSVSGSIASVELRKAINTLTLVFFTFMWNCVQFQTPAAHSKQESEEVKQAEDGRGWQHWW